MRNKHVIHLHAFITMGLGVQQLLNIDNNRAHLTQRLSDPPFGNVQMKSYLHSCRGQELRATVLPDWGIVEETSPRIPYLRATAGLGNCRGNFLTHPLGLLCSGGDRVPLRALIHSHGDSVGTLPRQSIRRIVLHQTIRLSAWVLCTPTRWR